MTNVNNFVDLNLTNLENAILKENYVLKFFREGSNLRVVRLEDCNGNFVSIEKGISLIPTIQRADESFIIGQTDDEPTKGYKITDCNLDNLILKGSELIIKKLHSSLTATIKIPKKAQLFFGSNKFLVALLANVEESLTTLYA